MYLKEALCAFRKLELVSFLSSSGCSWEAHSILYGSVISLYAGVSCGGIMILANTLLSPTNRTHTPARSYSLSLC